MDKLIHHYSDLSEKKNINECPAPEQLLLAFKILALSKFLQIHLAGIRSITTQLYFQGNYIYYICFSLTANTHFLVKTWNIV